MDFRQFIGVLVLNWKNGSMRVVRNAPSNTSPYEVCVRFNVRVEVPKAGNTDEMVKTIVVPKTKIAEAVLEDL